MSEMQYTNAHTIEWQKEKIKELQAEVEQLQANLDATKKANAYLNECYSNWSADAIRWKNKCEALQAEVERLKSEHQGELRVSASTVESPKVNPTSVKIYDQLVGLTFCSVKQNSNEELVFECENGKLFTFTHIADCCEEVQIEDICGDLQDLVGSPLLQAEEVTYSDVNPDGAPSKEHHDSFTWTFYKFATIKGSVTVRWYGQSNGYYSESVDLHESESE